MSFKDYDLLNYQQAVGYVHKNVRLINQKIKDVLNQHQFSTPNEFLGMHVPNLQQVSQWVKAHPDTAVSFKERKSNQWNDAHGVNFSNVIVYEMLTYTLPLLKRKAHWVQTVNIFNQDPKGQIVFLELKEHTDGPVQCINYCTDRDRQLGGRQLALANDWKHDKLDKASQNSLLTKYEREAYTEKVKSNQKNKESRQIVEPSYLGYAKQGNRIGGGLCSVRVWFNGTDLKKREVRHQIPEIIAKSNGLKPNDTATMRGYWAMTKNGYYAEDLFAQADGSTLIEEPRTYNDVKKVVETFPLDLKTGDKFSDEMIYYTRKTVSNFNHYIDSQLKDSVPDLTVPNNLARADKDYTKKAFIADIKDILAQISRDAKFDKKLAPIAKKLFAKPAKTKPAQKPKSTAPAHKSTEHKPTNEKPKLSDKVKAERQKHLSAQKKAVQKHKRSKKPLQLDLFSA